jgi:SAM-dependent methyltransferase
MTNFPGSARKLDKIWRCPRCRGDLFLRTDQLVCADCGSQYDLIYGIPDFRLPGPAWLDLESDREAARQLVRETSHLPVSEVVRSVFGSRELWSEEMAAKRTDQVLTAPDRLRKEIHGWLEPCVSQGVFLDLGCGPGMLLAAAAEEGYPGIGVDVSLVWLVVAHRLIEARGGRPVLAAALAEALPLADGTLAGVVSLDVIEHVYDPAPFVREIERVMAPGGGVALSTPNRFSLAAEPHVSIWGVGWLPRSLQKRYVKWRTGDPYEFVRLLSVAETYRLMRRNSAFRTRFQVPPVPDEEIARFPPLRARAARLYNQLAKQRVLKAILLAIGPFFRVVGVKPSVDGDLAEATSEFPSLPGRGV